MKTYNEYYSFFSNECWKQIKTREEVNGEKWWDNNSINDDVNDLPLVENKTHVNSSEYVILHEMICQLVIDNVNMCPLKNEVDGYSITINLETGDWNVYFDNIENIDLTTCLSDMNYSINTFTGVDNKKVVDSYDDLNEKIYFFICDFIRRHTKELDTSFTSVIFSMTDMGYSLKEGKWVSGTESSMSFYKDDEMVVCSM